MINLEAFEGQNLLIDSGFKLIEMEGYNWLKKGCYDIYIEIDPYNDSDDDDFMFSIYKKNDLIDEVYTLEGVKLFNKIHNIMINDNDFNDTVDALFSDDEITALEI